MKTYIAILLIFSCIGIVLVGQGMFFQSAFVDAYMPSEPHHSWSPLLQEEYKTNGTCAFCEVVVNLVEYEIKVANKTVNEIEEIVEWICERSSPPVKAECEVILKDLVEMIHLILSGLYPPKEICEKLGLC